MLCYRSYHLLFLSRNHPVPRGPVSPVGTTNYFTGTVSGQAATGNPHNPRAYGSPGPPRYRSNCDRNPVTPVCFFAHDRVSDALSRDLRAAGLGRSHSPSGTPPGGRVFHHWRPDKEIRRRVTGLLLRMSYEKESAHRSQQGKYGTKNQIFFRSTTTSRT